MLSEAYVSSMARGEVEANVIAEMDGWQLQFISRTKRRGVQFRVVDVRDPELRRDPMSPARRVWRLRYSVQFNSVGDTFEALQEFYPEVARWAAMSLRAYCEAG